MNRPLHGFVVDTDTDGGRQFREESFYSDLFPVIPVVVLPLDFYERILFAAVRNCEERLEIRDLEETLDLFQAEESDAD